jgi:cilia- and flagella-associated protein 57
MLFALKEGGGLKAYKFPFSNEGVGPDEFNDYHQHGVQMTQMKTSFNERYLFAGGIDGSVWIFRVQDKEGRIARQEKDWYFSEEIIVTKSELKESYRLLNDLKMKVADIQEQSDSEVKSKDASHAFKLEEITAKYCEEINRLRNASENLQIELQEMSAKNRSLCINSQKENAVELQEMKNAFLEKIESEKSRFACLVDKRNQLEAQWESQMKDINVEHHRKSEEIKTYFREIVEEIQNSITKTKKDTTKMILKHEIEVKDIEADVEKEYLEITYQFENKLKDEKSTLASVQADNTTMMNTYHSIQLDLENHKKQLMGSEKEVKRLIDSIKKLNEDIDGLNNELKEREDTIGEKEKRIYDLKKKNEELEKFKFVLDYRILDLRKKIEPREHNIAIMKKQIESMNLELKDYILKNSDLNQKRDELMLKYRATFTRRNTEAWKNQQVKNIIDTFIQHLYVAFKSIDDKPLLLKECVRLYNAYKNANENPPEWVPKNILSFEPQLYETKLQDCDGIVIDDVSKTREDVRNRKQLETTLKILQKNETSLMKIVKRDAKNIVIETMNLNQYIDLIQGIELSSSRSSEKANTNERACECKK